LRRHLHSVVSSQSENLNRVLNLTPRIIFFVKTLELTRPCTKSISDSLRYSVAKVPCKSLISANFSLPILFFAVCSRKPLLLPQHHTNWMVNERANIKLVLRRDSHTPLDSPSISGMAQVANLCASHHRKHSIWVHRIQGLSEPKRKVHPNHSGVSGTSRCNDTSIDFFSSVDA